MNTAIIDKISKLLNLAEGKGTTSAEASTAAEHAQRLMTKYRITMLDLEEAKQESIGHQMFDEPSWRVRSWRSILIGGVAKLQGCVPIAVKGDCATKRPARFMIFGTKTACQVTNYIYVFLAREIDRLAVEAERPPWEQADEFRNAFRLGAVQAVLARMRQEHQNEIETQGLSNQMIKIDSHLARVQEVLNNTIKVKSQKFSGGGSLSGRQAGEEAGKNIAIHRGVNEARGRKLLGG